MMAFLNVLLTRELLLPLKIFLLRGAWMSSRLRKTLQNRLNSYNSLQPSFSSKEPKVESKSPESSELK